MSDKEKSKESIIAELHQLRQQIQTLQTGYQQLKRERDVLEQKYYLLFNCSNDVICIYSFPFNDAPSRFIEVNRAACRQSGYTESEILQRSPIDMIAPEARAQFLQTIQELRHKKQVQFKTIHINKKGQRYPVEVNAHRVEFDGQQAVLSIAHDISQRKQVEAKLDTYSSHLEDLVKARTAELIAANEKLQREVQERRLAEEALKTSQEYAKNIIESSLDMIVAVNTDQYIIEFNKAAQKTFGYTREEAIGAHVSMLYADPAESREIYQTAIEQGRCIREILNRRKNGEIFPSFLSASVLYDAAGNRIGVMGVSRDITHRKKAEKALKQRNRELAMLNRVSQALISSSLHLNDLLATVLEEARNLLNVVACSVWLVDPSTGELVCREATNPQRDIIIGWQLAPGEGLAGWVAKTGKSLNIADAKKDVRHFDGVDEQTGLNLRSILTVPLRTKQRIVGVIQVVDERVNRFTANDVRLIEAVAANAAAAIENARLYEQTRQDAATKAMLLQEVNHRVKNNLAAIVGLLYAERNHASVKDDPTFQSIIQDLIGRVQGLATVHSILSASEWSPLSLTELINQVIYTSLQLLPDDKHIAVDVTSSPIKILPKQATPLALIVNELVTNAVKYAFANRENGRITVGILQEEDKIKLEFWDNGVGYPEALLNQQEFNVGLYLIQMIVRQDLEGTLTLYNNEQGATTCIEFTLYS